VDKEDKSTSSLKAIAIHCAVFYCQADNHSPQAMSISTASSMAVSHLAPDFGGEFCFHRAGSNAQRK
jgi:hypothetical protein